MGQTKSESKLSSGWGKRFFSSPDCLDKLWGPSSRNPVNNSGYFQEVKMPQHEPDHSSQFRDEVKNEQSYTSHSPICLHGVCWQLSTGTLLSCLYSINHDLQMSKLSLSWTKHHGKLIHWTVEAHLHAFLISALEQGKCSTSSPTYFIPGKRPPASIEYKARWAPDLDVLENRKISCHHPQ